MKHTKLYRIAGLFLAAAPLLVACGGDDDTTTAPPPPPPAPAPAPVIPAAKSEIVAPELTTACTIKGSSIKSLAVKGTAPAFNGAGFGTVGTYKYILAEATASVEASDPCAPTIVDLKNSADASGLVTYKFDVVILTPNDPGKASGTLLYIVNNRTNTSSLEALNDGSSNNLFDNRAAVIPTSAATPVVTPLGAGSGFLMKQGMTVVISGWQGDMPSSLSGASAAITSTQKWYPTGMTLPVAKRASGEVITGSVQDEFIANSANLTTNKLGTYYKRVDGSAATLTIRKTPTSLPVTVDASLWTYTAGSGTAAGGDTTTNGFGFVTIDRAGVTANPAYATALDAGKDYGSIYHFNYVAKDPKPLGLGFLATRDLISFLRYEDKDGAGNANPLAGQVKRTLATGISQSGRYLRDFLWQGFNTDKSMRIVFDGMLPLVGGSRKTYTNYRWAKPGDYSRQHETHYTPGDQFPFSYATITDPISGKTDGLLKKCTELNTCPKVFQYDSPIEFGGARASLVSTDGIGKDVDIPANVRLFYAAGTSHGPQQLSSNAGMDYSVYAATASPSGASTASGARNASTALFRALLLNLEGWVSGTAQPLASAWPKVADGTMAIPTFDPSSLSAPDLSAMGINFNGVYNTLTLNDESVIPSAVGTQAYVVHLPTTDAQGNSRAGAKMPDSVVPLATFLGYNLRPAGYVAGNQNGLSSSQLAFALLTAEKNPGDPRMSVQQLYTSKTGYLAAWNSAVDALVSQGLMLPVDADQYKARGVRQTNEANFSRLP